MVGKSKWVHPPDGRIEKVSKSLDGTKVKVSEYTRWQDHKGKMLGQSMWVNPPDDRTAKVNKFTRLQYNEGEEIIRIVVKWKNETNH